jgi:hypothetical protein
MSDSRRWRTLLKRLAYLRAEAADSVDSFEESVKEIESKIGREKDIDVVVDHPVASGDVDEVKTSASVPTENSENSCDLSIIKNSDTRNESRSRQQNEQNEQVEDASNQGPDETKIQYRKLWKAIARVTHPDIAGKNEDMTCLYRAAAKAHEKGNREELLDVASEVGIQMTNPHNILLEDLARRCSYYEQMIKRVRDSIAWQWKHSPKGTQEEIINLIKSKRSKKSS